ncbi:SPBc2 prophage-derived glycosyltransferase SunS [Clostridium homopropionicum DSM 5847]|uniref:SPBc2 prophage-derived glycosyltransferase SunS n=1 Tax=Clostridium homopropionicum DSM 5847 TaxID=1121318 RepID=A0A0L6ZDK0_9CLOT|nr:glycosyltransferase family 2 protein [Clostridium homopropionicum]KOA21040.1 SPBc2 prophage-derived glycosyltransferase SunS [Clostridium homopropionicum DSM 5847]SFF98752.1 pentatricopeptide repeat domain-containing protein (PPR motif) [Clostridium homopropionicum]
MKLSVCMIVKNEEKNLDRCLNSLQYIVNNLQAEIIIVDTGSDDRTVEIAKKYTDKVYFHNWNNNFSEMRNISISYAKGEWILIIDADEEVADGKDIIKFLNSNESNFYKTGILIVKNVFRKNNFDTFSQLKSPRLFKRDKELRYKGSIHNQPVYKEPIIQINSELMHYGYMNDDKELMEKKFIRTSNMLKKELEKNPNHIYYRFQLSVSYAMHDDFKDALDEALIAYNSLSKLTKEEKKNYMYIYNQLIKCYLVNNRFREAEDVSAESISIDEKNIDGYLYLGKLQYDKNDFNNSQINFEKYLLLIDKYKKSFSIKETTSVIYTLDKEFIAHESLFKIYLAKSQYDQAFEIINRTENTNVIKENLRDIVKVFLNLGKINEIIKFYDDKKIEKDEELYNNFIFSIEDNIKHYYTKDNMIIYTKFAKDSTNYGLLNKVRIAYYDNYNTLNDRINELIGRLDFNNCIDFFGDLFYIMFNLGKAVEQIFLNISEKNLNTYLQFIKDHHEDSRKVVLEYLMRLSSNEDFAIIKTRKVLLRTVLSMENIDDMEYLKMFKEYLTSGISYVELLYNKNILINELIYDMKNDEEILFLYMYKAERLYKDNELQYIKYLRKALEKVPMMKKGIELLLDDVVEKHNSDNVEMEKLKMQLKENVKSLIEQEKVTEAKSLISEYEKIVPDDIEMVLLKSQIALINSNRDNERYKM